MYNLLIIARLDILFGEPTDAPATLLLIINLNVANIPWDAGSRNARERAGDATTSTVVGNKRRWWPKPGINYRVVVLAIVFNCGDA